MPPVAHPPVRPAVSADLPDLARLFDLYRQFYEQAPDRPAALAFLQQRLAQQDSVLLVAPRDAAAGATVPATPFDGETLLGFCQLYPSHCSVQARPIYVLYDLYVQPASRRLGLGRHLLLAAQARAAADGKARMDLTTARSNHTAQALYESLGWVRDDIFLAYSRRVAVP